LIKEAEDIMFGAARKNTKNFPKFVVIREMED